MAVMPGIKASSCFFLLRSMFITAVITPLIISCGKPSAAERTSSNAVEHTGAWLTTNGSYELDLAWKSGPQTGMNNVARLTVILRGDATFPLQKITVTPWMTVHGHGSGNVQPVVENDDGGDATLDPAVGVYRVSNIFFVMSGPWDLKIELSNENENGTVTDSVTVPVEVPGA